MEIEVQFLNTGHRQYTQASKITRGIVKDQSLVVLVEGIGIYDQPKMINNDPNNKLEKLYYKKWVAVLSRCSEVYKSKKPTYQKCECSEDWVYYTKFKAWLVSQDIEAHGWDLQVDKDILFSENKLYSLETCCLVPNWLNMTVVCGKGQDNILPKGVVACRKQFRSYISRNNKSIFLGRYETSTLAHVAWQNAKATAIEEDITKYAREKYFRTDVADALMRRVWDLRLAAAIGNETKNL